MGGIVSSHHLKCLLFEEVKHHPDPPDWEGERLLDRLVGILGAIGVKHGQQGWASCMDIITNTGVISRHSDSAFNHPSILDDLDAMISQFQSKSSNSPTTYHGIPSHTVYLKGTNGQLHMAVLSKDIALSTEEVHTYIPPSSPQAPYQTHPLIQWCRHYIGSLYKRNHGTDLTLIPREDLSYVWGLVFGGSLTQDDINTKQYLMKVNRLKELMEQYKGVKIGYKKDDLWGKVVIRNLRRQQSCPTSLRCV